MRPQQVAQLPHRMRVQPGRQHLLEQLPLGLHMAAERGQDGGLGTACGQSVEDLAAVAAEAVRQRSALLALTLIRENLQIAISPGGRKSRKQIRFCRRGTNVTVAASPFYSVACPSYTHASLCQIDPVYQPSRVGLVRSVSHELV